jgi:hypothetical protein
MNNDNPLTPLIGSWQGDKGQDIAPEPDGIETNLFYETFIFSETDDVSNAESQTLAAVHYRQRVRRISDDKLIHDETGYWMWDSETDVVMHSLTIPRAVCVLAGGNYHHEQETTTFTVSANINDPDWQILQSPFMKKNAMTKSFSQSLTVSGSTLSYNEMTIVDIYGREFEHSDQNVLTRQ